MNENNIDPNLVEEFKNNAKRWLVLCNDMKKLNNALKELRVEKNNLTKIIETFMSTYDVGDCKMNNGTIKYKQKWKKESINRQNIQQKLSMFLKNIDQAEKATQYIYDNREKTLTHGISFVAPKK